MAYTNKKILFIFFILFCSIALLLSISDRSALHLKADDGTLLLSRNFMIYYHGVIDQSFPAPYSYRILIPFTIYGINIALPALNPVTIDFVLKIILLISCQWLFFCYLKIFFETAAALTGMFLLDVLMSFSLSSIQGPSVIETIDLFNLGIFIAAFIQLQKEQWAPLYPLIFLGMFNRETPLFIIPIAFMVSASVRQNPVRLFAVSMCGLLPFAAIRFFLHPPVTEWFTMSGIGRNIPFLSEETTMNAVMGNIHFISLIGPLAGISLLKFSQHPPFLRKVAYITPFFIIVHYTVGNLVESRMWMPLFVILIPLALNSIFLLLNKNETK